MARITIEDCLEVIPNRFDMVLAASKRARYLAKSGDDSLMDWERDKPTVVALREIAAGYLTEEGNVRADLQRAGADNDLEM